MQQPQNISTSSSSSPSSKIIIPDLVSHCNFPLRNNRHRKQATVECKQWLFRGGNLNQKTRDAFHGLKAGLLTSMCYPGAAYPQLRVCCDFMNWLFHLDNISDDMTDRGTSHTGVDIMNTLWCPETHCPTTRVGKMTKDFWRRLTPTATPGTQQRFRETMDFFFQAVTQQAIDRATGTTPDLESYITLRRDTSGCKPCWALIEFAYNLNIPDEVMDHPVICSLGEATNDLVTWSNDIFSYNVEQSKNDTHNMIPVVMKQEGIDLQSAVDFVGEMCRQSIDRFIADRANLPSWGPEIDRQVDIYVNGLADWIVGSLHWSFESERYFGKAGLEVKKTRVVTLMPKRRGVKLSVDIPKANLKPMAPHRACEAGLDSAPQTPVDEYIDSAPVVVAGLDYALGTAFSTEQTLLAEPFPADILLDCDSMLAMPTLDRMSAKGNTAGATCLCNKLAVIQPDQDIDYVAFMDASYRMFNKNRIPYQDTTSAAAYPGNYAYTRAYADWKYITDNCPQALYQ